MTSHLKRYALAFAVGVLLTGAIFAIRGKGTSPEPKPSPEGLEAVGKQYAPELSRAYAESLRVAAGVIAEGKSIPEAQEIQQAAFKSARELAFEAKLRPVLSDVVPEGSDLSDPNQRNALVQAFQELAAGLAPVEPVRASDRLVGAEEFPTGWIDDPARRGALAATLNGPNLALAAPDLMQDEDPGDIFLYKAYTEVLGEYPSYQAQTIGDCVGQGTGHANDLLQCIDIAIAAGDGTPDANLYRETSTEAAYALSREVAGLLGSRGDGSYGVAAAKAMTTFGVVSREFVGGGYSGARARDWGRRGVPAEVKAEASKFKLGTATLVTTTAEADAALANGYPYIVCSMQGFTMQRDATGRCAPQGRWAHCMFVAGRRVRSGNVQYLVCQSWGPNVPSGPLADGQPDFSFWVDRPVMARMLSERDSFAFAGFPGFVERPIPTRWTYSGFAEPEAKPEPKAKPDAAPTVIRMPPRVLPVAMRPAA